MGTKLFCSGFSLANLSWFQIPIRVPCDYVHSYDFSVLIKISDILIAYYLSEQSEFNPLKLPRLQTFDDIYYIYIFSSVNTIFRLLSWE